MNKTEFTESQIIKAFKEAENGRPVAKVSRELGITLRPFITGRRSGSVVDWYLKNKA